MKPVSRLFIVFSCFIAIGSPQALAGAGMEIPADKSSPELNRIKSLEGKWVATTSMFGKKNQRVYTQYEVTSNGAAVLERIMPGTPMEMISVYYDDDSGKLAMTHYCIMRNRPDLKLKSATADTIKLDVAKISGLKNKKGPAMGGVTLQFKGKNHITATCEGKGKNAGPPMTMEYTRVL